MDANTTHITTEQAGTLDGLFRQRVANTPNTIAYQEYHRASATWQSFTWQDMANEVGRWQAALAQEHLRQGDRVALLLRNCPEWVAFEQAALGLGLVVVPLYCDDRPDNIAYILRDAGVKVLLLENTRQCHNLAPLRDAINEVQRYVILEGDAAELSQQVPAVTAQDWLPATPSPLKERDGNPHQLATIVYTSGTTGKPKGVMLSHRNILSNAEGAIYAMDVLNESHTLLSFLPLSHTFERTTGYYAPMMEGFTVAFARSIQQLAEDMQAIRPTILISVPRIFERVYDRLQSQLAKKPLHERMLFNLTMQIGYLRFEVAQGRALWQPQLLLWPLLDRLVASKLRAIFGGRLHIAVSGGAALTPTIAKVIIGMDLTLIQGYGMTETSPVVAANMPSQNDPCSVGKAMRGIEVCLGEHDELQVRGPNVMLGYWNNHKATADTILPDGWLRTGDKARIENDYIYITGRLKDILVLSNGEKIPPGDMESAILLKPLFEQTMIIGEGKPYLSALTVLNAEQWVRLAKTHNIDPFDQGNLQLKPLQHAILKTLAEALHEFPGYAKVRRVTPLLDPWTVDNGLLTPTLKVKRAVVMQHFQSQIEAMYAE